MCETYPPERYFVSVFTFVHIGVPPFSVREDSLLNSKHISPERCFVVCVIIRGGVPLSPVRVSRGGHWPPLSFCPELKPGGRNHNVATLFP